MSFRRAMKKAIASLHARRRPGHPYQLHGPSGGSEMARFETYREGRAQYTLRADIDFARATANTAYGTCGVKVGCSTVKCSKQPATTAAWLQAGDLRPC